MWGIHGLTRPLPWRSNVRLCMLRRAARATGAGNPSRPSPRCPPLVARARLEPKPRRPPWPAPTPATTPLTAPPRRHPSPTTHRGARDRDRHPDAGGRRRPSRLNHPPPAPLPRADLHNATPSPGEPRLDVLCIVKAREMRHGCRRSRALTRYAGRARSGNRQSPADRPVPPPATHPGPPQVPAPRDAPGPRNAPGPGDPPRGPVDRCHPTPAPAARTERAPARRAGCSARTRSRPSPSPAAKPRCPEA
jgi:hypothetical protein